MLAPPRSFSQLTASFVASRCQGIRRAPVYAWPEMNSPPIPFTLQLFSTQTVQLSKIDPPGGGKSCRSAEEVVGVPGIEPGTSSLSGTRSNQLSYTPVVEAAGLEPAASSLQSWRSTN